MLLQTLPPALAAWFSALDEFDDCVFKTSYPPGSAVNPIARPTVVIGAGDMRIGDASAPDRRPADTTFTLSVYVPLSLGGAAAQDVAARVLEALLFSSDLELTGTSAAPVKYERSANALRMDVTFTVRETVFPTQTYVPEFSG